MIITMIILIFFVLLLGLFYKRRAEHLIEANLLMDKYFKSAGAVASNEDTPDVVLDLIESLTHRIRDRSSMRSFFFFLLSGRARNVMTSRKEEIAQIQSQIDMLPLSVKGHFFTAINVGFLIISFNSFFIGPLFRRVIMFDIHVARKAKEQQEAHRTEHLIAAYKTANLDKHVTCQRLMAT
jgi:hypothetical protein